MRNYLNFIPSNRQLKGEKYWKTEETQRKLYVHNNDMVTWWLLQPSWMFTVLQRCTVGDGDVLGAVKDQILAWKWWHAHDKLRVLWAPSAHFSVNANMWGVKVGKEVLQSRQHFLKKSQSQNMIESFLTSLIFAAIFKNDLFPRFIV